jgi:hypothetical protein
MSRNALICRDPRGARTELQLPRTVLQHRRLGVVADLHAFLAAEGITPPPRPAGSPTASAWPMIVLLVDDG